MTLWHRFKNQVGLVKTDRLLWPANGDVYWQQISREIKDINLHPFILVRVGEPGQSGARLVICPTQNETGKFVDELTQLPEFKDSLLLQGLCCALQSEVYDAADLLFSWVKGANIGLRETAYIHLPDDDERETYYGYPVFELGVGAPLHDPNERIELLSCLFDAYERIQGNNAMRFALMEALAFALSRALGARAEFARALAIVDRGLLPTPRSIHLKSAKHALGVKLTGAELPQRLEKFVGEDNGYLRSFVCPIPFERMDVSYNGDVLVCCGHWLPTVIGNIMRSPTNEVMNSNKAQKIRELVTDGSFKYCNHLECLVMSQGQLPRKNNFTKPQIQQAIDTKRYEIDGIERLLFGFDQTCNLSCPSCRIDRITEKASESTEKAKVVEERILPLLPSLKTLYINPAGELFASKPSRKILELINDEACPNLVLEIISNGTLFNRREWERYPNIHNKVFSVRISTDAASKATFEKLRRLGNYEIFLENMRFLSELRRNEQIGLLTFSFTYQLENFREMRSFVNFVRSMNGDVALFERLQNLGAFSDADYRSKAVHYPEHPMHQEFLKEISDPVFRDTTIVVHDFEFAGWEGTKSDVVREGRETWDQWGEAQIKFLERGRSRQLAEGK